MQIWVRCGDQDNYNSFDSIEEAAEYMHNMGVASTIRVQNEYGVADDGDYYGHNYVSLFWGGDTADDVQRGFTSEEIESLNNILARSEQ